MDQNILNLFDKIEINYFFKNNKQLNEKIIKEYFNENYDFEIFDKIILLVYQMIQYETIFDENVLKIKNVFNFFKLLFMLPKYDICFFEDTSLLDFKHYGLIYEIISDEDLFTTGQREELAILFLKSDSPDAIIRYFAYEIKKLKNII